MAVVLKPTVPAVFDLKSAAMTVVAVVLRTTDLTLLAAELEARFGGAAQLFDQDPVVIDLSPVRDDDLPLDVPALVALLRRYRMVPIAVKGGSIVQMDAALAIGLGAAPEGAPPREEPAPAPSSAASSASAPPPVLREVVVAQPRTALLIDKPLRSGQQVYAKGGDLVVMAAVSFGAEVIADGSVHVYAPLRGRAIAGARGDTSARIFSTCMEPQLVSIAGTYRTLEAPLPDEVLGKPAQVRLDGEKLVVEALRH